MWFSLAQATRAGADAGSVVDEDALSEMLAPAFPGQRVLVAEVLSGGFANMNYKVTLSNMGAPVVVRVYIRDRSAAYREASILQLLHDRVPVAEVLYVSPEVREPHAYLVLSWVGGVSLDQILAEASPADSRCAVRSAGSVLARLQAFRFADSGFFGRKLEIRTPFSSSRLAVVGVMEQFLFHDTGEERLGVALSQRVWRFITEHEESLAAIEGHAMLVHGDFGGPNVVVQASSGGLRVAALIDWEYAHSGTPLVDLGSMLRRPGHELVPWFEEEFLRGYRRDGGILPENWRQVSRIVDLVKLCAFVRSPNAGEVAVQSVRALVESALNEEHR